MLRPTLEMGHAAGPVRSQISAVPTSAPSRPGRCAVPRRSTTAVLASRSLPDGACFTYALVLATGCGRSSLDEDYASTTTGTATCGPSTWPDGCCDSSDACRTGSDVRVRLGRWSVLGLHRRPLHALHGVARVRPRRRRLQRDDVLGLLHRRRRAAPVPRRQRVAAPAAAIGFVSWRR